MATTAAAAPRKPCLYMTVGLPGSGKSTWAREMLQAAAPGSIIRVNKDDLRAMMHNSVHAGKATESQIIAARDILVTNALLDGKDVIVDDTNVQMTHEKQLRQLAARYGADFVVQSFAHVDLHECIRRDAARTGRAHVGEDIIRKMHQALRHRKEAPLGLEADFYVPPVGAEHVTLFDVDGTLALMSDRKPFHWNRVGEDMPNPPVVDLARMFLAAGRKIVVMSGRSEVCREATQDWLDKHVGLDLPLFMRKDKDQRPDFIVKYDLFQEHIAGRYAVDLVVDDRDMVVVMWRRTLGLTCLQVAEGRF